LAAGRRRPLVLIDPLAFSPIISGWRGFTDEPNLSFPSGHTTLAFATAATLGIWIPRWRYVFYALACVTAAERVAENAHYVTDVIAGAGLGTLSAYLTFWAVERLARRAAAAGQDSGGADDRQRLGTNDDALARPAQG
jgi:membrane-associated phospholipid phosphatase